MRNIMAIAKREVGSYFVSPIAYIVTAAFLVITGYLFAMILFYSREATMSYLFRYMTTILIFVAPLLTMRLLAEEQRSGTIEILLTSPVRDGEVVMGKFLASLCLLTIMLALTLYYPLILELFGNPDRGPIAAGYLGLFLLGGALLAAGVLTSSLTQNQIVAAVLGVAVALFLWLCGALTDFVGPPLGGFFHYLALSSHFFDFPKGVVDSKDVIYYLSVTAACLFLATRSLETRRWR